MNDSTGTVSAHPAGDIVSQYQPPNQLFDEMLGSGGYVRPAWSRLAQSLNDEGSAGLGRRSDQARHLLRENGVTYNVYGAAKDLERPWELDPIPLMIPIEEWKVLADALKQRARLSNRILADVYGSQELMRSGVLPPNSLFEHPNYLLPCVGIKPPRRNLRSLVCRSVGTRRTRPMDCAR